MLYFFSSTPIYRGPKSWPLFLQDSFVGHIYFVSFLFPSPSPPPPIAIGLEKEGAGRLSSDGMTPGRTSLDRMEDKEAKLRTRVGEA